MQISQTKLSGVLLIEPKVFKDPRGFFLETWHATRYADFGIPSNFVQDNVSLSSRGVLRGLHFQNPNGQGKLLSVLEGEIFDVAVDIRVGSPTFGQWVGFALSAYNNHQLWVPAGFAHGFCVVSEKALVIYKCTELYAPRFEASLLYKDPDIGVVWPDIKLSLSEKDLKARQLKDIPLSELPQYGN